MRAKHSEAFIEQALVKVYSRGERSVKAVADELNVNYHSLKNWMRRKSVVKQEHVEKQERRPQDWTAEQQLNALQETHALSGEALHAWCREHGIFPHHLNEWKAAFCAPVKESPPSAREVRKLEAEIAKLKLEATRKDKALAEAAALLVLQKKFRALWEDEEK
jgi:transposase